ncbi:hypothetical protein ACQKMV_11480 [Lysinibacillus sp. NPDC094403]|uniref:hypothetical protein n=1 Tax=Lysinibacillus sp. NPDC094403 TaxID=3390581 RepID=UPI003D03DB64
MFRFTPEDYVVRVLFEHFNHCYITILFQLVTYDEESLIFHGEWRLLRDELALKAPQECSDEEIEAKPAESESANSE